MARQECDYYSGGIRAITNSPVSVSLSGSGTAIRTIDFTSDMTANEDIISVSVAGTGSESVVPRFWIKKTRSTVQVSLRNLSSSSQTAGLEVQVIVAEGNHI